MIQTNPVNILQAGTTNVTNNTQTPGTSVDSPAGALVAVAISGVGTTIATLTDDAGNTYGFTARSNTNFDIEIWFVANAKHMAVGTKFTATTAAGGASQYSLNVAASVLGYNGGFSVSGAAHSTGAVTTLTTTSASISNRPSMAFAAFNGMGGGTWTEDTNWTELATTPATNNPMAWRQITATGTTAWAPSWGTAATVDGLIVVFNPTPGPPLLWRNEHVPPPDWTIKSSDMVAQTLRILSLPKIFNAGGQVPAKQWRYDYVPETMWYVQRSEWMNSAVLQLLTQPKQFRAGGQVLQKLWRYDLDTDIRTWAPELEHLNAGVLQQLDFKPRIPPLWANVYYEPPSWAPTAENLDADALLMLAAKPVVPPLWSDTYYEPPPWYPTPENLDSDALQMLAFKPRIPPLWSDTYVPPPDWLGTPTAPIQVLYQANPEPFSEFWRYDHVPPPDWLGQPVAMPTINAITASATISMPPFYVRTQQDVAALWGFAPQGVPITLEPFAATPFNKLWRYDTVPAPDWLGTPRATPAIAVYGTTFTGAAAPFYTRSQQDIAALWGFASQAPSIALKPAAAPFSTSWRPDTVPQPDWLGAPLSAATLTKLVIGGRPFFKFWRWDYEPDKNWLGGAPQSAATLTQLVIGGKPFAKQWRWDYQIEAPQWQGAPVANRAITQIVPFAKLWRWDQVAAPDWLGTPLASAIISDLTAGGKPFARLWRWDHVPSPDWVGTPLAPMQSLIAVGPEPFFQLWRYDTVPPPDWLGTPLALPTINAITAAVTVPTGPVFARTMQDMAALWQWPGPIGPLQFLLVKGADPFKPPQWSDTFVPAPNWIGRPVAVPTISALTAAVTVTKGPFFAHTFVPATDWLGAPRSVSTITLLTFGGNPFSKLWRWDQVPATEWVGRSTSPLRGLLAAAIRPFNKFWRWDQVAASEWIGQSVASVLALHAPAATPFISLPWRADYVMPPNWVAVLPTAWVLYLPVEVIDEDGHAWRRILAFTQPDAILNRDVPRYLAVYEEDEEELIIYLLGDL